MINTKSEQLELLESLDKKIIIKEVKEKGKNKTYIQGFQSYEEFKDSEVLKKAVKDMKNKFGCACTIVNENNQYKLMLQGFHKEKIKNYFNEKYPNVKTE
ncbi:translation initiation factor SUI1 [Catovirus CTV1]|uniref:Translation initiation factor SUI1 n=1 Tax=Catovirus CTV1 TaxID=1977631 RepID=A0A1V0SAX6_9VIRU|nr:translation initiation factor SUI1 [Catovirus CTV1]